MRTIILLAGLALILAAGASHGHPGHAGHQSPHAPAGDQATTDDEDATEAVLRARYEAAKRTLEALLAAGAGSSSTDTKLAEAVTEFVEHAIAYYVCQGCAEDVHQPSVPDSAGISRASVRGTSAADLIDYLKDMADGGPWGPPGNTWQRWPQLPLWEGRPIVRVRANVDPEYHAMTAKAVDLINDWLPPEHRMIMGEPTFLMGVGLHPVYGHEHPVWDPKDVPAGVIYVDFETPHPGAQSRYNESGSRYTTTDVPRMISNLVVINADFFGDYIRECRNALKRPGRKQGPGLITTDGWSTEVPPTLSRPGVASEPASPDTAPLRAGVPSTPR